MKGKVFGVVLVLALVFAMMASVSCTKTTPASPEPTAVPTAGPVLGPFSFETSLMGWGFLENMSTGFSVSSTYAYAGTSSMDVAAAFNSASANGRSAMVSMTTTAKDLTGKCIYARVYVPATWPTAGGQAGGAKVFSISGSSSYAEGSDYNFYPGQWIQIHQNAAQITDPATVVKIGINAYVDGGWTGTATSDLFVDSIEIGPIFVDGAYNFTTNNTACWQHQAQSYDATTGISWNTTQGATAAGSLKVAAVFDASHTQFNLLRDLKTNVSFSASTISCKIKAPTAVLALTGDTDVFKVGIHIQDNGWADSSGGYVSLTSANVVNGWITATWTGVTAANAQRIYIQVFAAGAATPATGTGDWYVDDITWN